MACKPYTPSQCSCVSSHAPSAVTEHVRQSEPHTLGDSRGSSWVQQAALAAAAAGEAAGALGFQQAALAEATAHMNSVMLTGDCMTAKHDVWYFWWRHSGCGTVTVLCAAAQLFST